MKRNTKEYPTGYWAEDGKFHIPCANNTGAEIVMPYPSPNIVEELTNKLKNIGMVKASYCNDLAKLFNEKCGRDLCPTVWLASKETKNEEWRRDGSWSAEMYPFNEEPILFIGPDNCLDVCKRILEETLPEECRRGRTIRGSTIISCRLDLKAGKGYGRVLNRKGYGRVLDSSYAREM